MNPTLQPLQAKPPKWVGIVLLVSFTLLLGVPLLVELLFRDLPYIHTIPLLGRFFIAMAVLLGLLALANLYAPVGSFKARLKSNSPGSNLGALLGLAMFSFFAAALSGNVLGLAVKLLPGREYRTTATLLDVDYGSVGVPYKGESLVLRDASGKTFHLEMSGRLFDRQQFEVGDTLKLSGKQNIFGTYVEDVGKDSGG